VYSVGSNGKTTVTLELEPDEVVTLSTDQPGNVGVVAMQIQGAPAAVERKRAREETHMNEEGRPGMFDVRPPHFDDEDVGLTSWKEKGSEQHPRPVHRHPTSFRKLSSIFRRRLLSFSLR
jgi:hypothetical protein